MRIRLLPSSPTDPGTLQPLSTLLVNDTLAIDGGSLGVGLGVEEQRRVRSIIVTHSHADHIASLPVFLAEVYPFLEGPVSVHSIPEVIGALRRHVFNDIVSPDFGTIELPRGGGRGLRYVEIEPLVPFEVEGLRVTAVEVNHTVRTIGMVLEDDRSAVVVTADTHHTEEIWRRANGLDRLKGIFVDVSYPDEMDELAAVSKHLTPRSLALELQKLQRRVPVLAVHLKPQFHAVVRRQLADLGRADIEVAEIGREYAF